MVSVIWDDEFHVYSLYWLFCSSLSVECQPCFSTPWKRCQFSSSQQGRVTGGFLPTSIRNSLIIHLRLKVSTAVNDDACQLVTLFSEEFLKSDTWVICPSNNTVTTTNCLYALHLPVPFKGGHRKSPSKTSKSTFCYLLFMNTLPLHVLFHFVYKSPLRFCAAGYLFIEGIEERGCNAPRKAQAR